METGTRSIEDAIKQMNSLPDVSREDSPRLQEFCRVTAVEVKAVGGVGAATSLEMIGYIRELEMKLRANDVAPDERERDKAFKEFWRETESERPFDPAHPKRYETFTKRYAPPTPQETPARQQESLPFKLPLSVGRMPIHGSKIVDANGSLLVHDVYRHDIAEALVKATNRDPAFRKLVEAAELLISEIGGYQNVIQLEGFTKLREALRLAREGGE